MLLRLMRKYKRLPDCNRVIVVSNLTVSPPVIMVDISEKVEVEKYVYSIKSFYGETTIILNI